MSAHKLANKFVVLQSRSPLLNRRYAKVIDWWANVVSKVTIGPHIDTYNYRLNAYNLPRDDQVILVEVDECNYLIHATEIDEESVTFFPPTNQSQSASIAALNATIDIIMRRLLHEPDPLIAFGYHGTDYELHPAVLKLNEILLNMRRQEIDAAEVIRQLKNRIEEYTKQMKAVQTVANECIAEMARGMSPHCPEPARRSYFNRIVTHLQKIVNWQ